MSGGLFSRLLRGRFGSVVLPAVILQSVLIGGGYATGREIVAYGARFGAQGWIAVVAVFAGFTLMSFVTFEVARVCGAYDYKSFIRELIGRGWPLFDLLYGVMAVIVIAVMASAAANILEETLSVPPLVGTAGVILAVGVLTYQGARVIEAFKSVGTSLLYGAYLLFSGIVLLRRWDGVEAVFAAGDVSHAPEVGAAAVLGTGILYVGYNLAVYPAVLFTLHRQESRRETAAAALLSGLLMTLPFGLTYLCLMGFYPSAEVLDAPVPWLPMLRETGGRAVVVVFGAVMGWTLLETSVGMIHAILDRIDADLERTGIGGLTPLQSGLLGAGILTAAALLSRVGIIELVAKGYAAMGYAFIALFALPLLTVGAWKVWGSGRASGLGGP